MKEFYSPAEIEGMRLPDLPAQARHITDYANREGWRTAVTVNGDPLARKRKGHGGGWEYHWTLFPVAAQRALHKREIARKQKEDSIPAVRGATAARVDWDWFERQPDARKNKARYRLSILEAICALQRGALSKDRAVYAVADQQKVGKSTIFNWFKLVEGLDRKDWLPALCPRHTGRTKTTECDPRAWEFIKADWLRQAQPTFSSCYRRLTKVAAEKGWTVPPERTLQRRMGDIAPEIAVLMREGPEAASRLYPWQQRDRAQLHALEAVNADCHTADVWVNYPGEKKPVRPTLIVIQDLFSNKILAWRIDLAPSATAVRLCFYDVFRTDGIPTKAFLDNGREFAAKMITGGQKTRYRFKVTADEMNGVLTDLGVEVHWTKPYSGQSKPIERAFRDFCADIWKHPACEGAYSGNSPTNKPENAGTRAIEFEEFVALIESGVAEYNARPGRKTDVCKVRQWSFDEAFAWSYERSPIRKASDEMLRMAMLSSKGVTARKPDGSVWLMDNRYHADFLWGHIGAKVALRFDPEDLHAGVHVYHLNGAYIGFAECLEKIGFSDIAAGRAHERNRRKMQKNLNERRDLEISLGWQEVAALEAGVRTTPATPPEARLVHPVRPARGNTGNAALEEEFVEEARALDRDEQTTRILRVVEGGRRD
tara:strand:+ start:1947 stop:3911 length:1965 start_codon:yes stop_codon:yes gene_type:complete